MRSMRKAVAHNADGTRMQLRGRGGVQDNRLTARETDSNDNELAHAMQRTASDNHSLRGDNVFFLGQCGTVHFSGASHRSGGVADSLEGAVTYPVPRRGFVIHARASSVQDTEGRGSDSALRA